MRDSIGFPLPVVCVVRETRQKYKVSSEVGEDYVGLSLMIH